MASRTAGRLKRLARDLEERRSRYLRRHPPERAIAIVDKLGNIVELLGSGPIMIVLPQKGEECSDDDIMPLVPPAK